MDYLVCYRVLDVFHVKFGPQWHHYVEVVSASGPIACSEDLQAVAASLKELHPGKRLEITGITPAEVRP